MKNCELNINASVSTVVDENNTAIAAQSGSLPVFATPFMVALMEKATCDTVAPYLEDGETTVGTKIDVAHNRASAIGTKITASAILKDLDGRKLVFEVEAKDDKDNIIGKGTIERFLVNSQKFLSKLG